MMKTQTGWIMIAGVLLWLWASLASAAEPAHFTGVHRAAEYLFVYGTSLTIAGEPAQPGDEVGVVSAAGILCGAGVVVEAGKYPAVSVYKDDPMTAAADGAVADEPLEFRLYDASADREYGTLETSVTFTEKQSASGQPYWTGNFDVYRVDLAAVEGREVVTLTLWPGWNLLSLPFDTEPGQGPAEVLRTAEGVVLYSGTVWRWDSRRQEYVAVHSQFRATDGFWVYCPAPAMATTKPLTGVAPPNKVTLNAKWNLLGPTRSAARAEIEGMQTAQGIFRWAADRQCYGAVDPGTPLKRGEGHWVYSRQ